MEYYAWPLVTTVLMFASYWIGKITSFADGFDEGHDEGCQNGSVATAKVVLEYMRSTYDINISDFEIKEIVDGISITEVEQKG